MRNDSVKKDRGFTLVEALIALVVLSFGLLAIAQFQSKLVSESAYNKARAEAVALAQQKLDDLRNYATQPGLVANLEAAATPTETDVFPDDVTNGDYPTTAESIPGKNADFTRQWNVSGTGDVKSVVVTVDWNDPKEGDQSVKLETRMTWKNPRGTGDLDYNEEPLVPSATGEAKLGDGIVTNDQLSDPNNNAHDNQDGTSTMERGNDLVLVDTSDTTATEHQVVLTLEDACVSGSCTQFVEIKGTVYIDKAPTHLDDHVENIHILASDAAYCARTAVETTANSDYDYFHYTCYLGGGWHGNIGVLWSGGNTGDTVCIGDPNATDTPSERWKAVKLAKRRVYRGMLHQEDINGIPLEDGSGNVIYYSLGIADAAVLPDPNWADRYYGHDYVLTNISGSPTVDDCYPVLTRTDSASGTLFAGVPNDFICLNEHDPALTASPYLDNYDTNVYVAGDHCPYNPATPPSQTYTISGTITGASDLAGVTVETSDGEGNCTDLSTASGTSVDYSCNIYIWTDVGGDPIPWVGTVTVEKKPDMGCTPYPRTYTSVATNLTGQNFDCQNLAHPHVQGTITLNGSNPSFIKPDVYIDDDITDTNPGVQCVVTADMADLTLYTYDCSAYEPSLGAGWSGRVTVTPPGVMLCAPALRDYTTISSDQTAQNYLCDDPTAVTVDLQVTNNSTGTFTVAMSPGGCVDDLDGTFTCTASDTAGAPPATITVTSTKTVCLYPATAGDTLTFNALGVYIRSVSIENNATACTTAGGQVLP